MEAVQYFSIPIINERILSRNSLHFRNIQTGALYNHRHIALQYLTINISLLKVYHIAL